MDDIWVRALQLSYRYNSETGILVFSDGVKYNLFESILLSKGKLCDEDLMAIHQVKKVFDGEIEDYFGRTMPEHDREMQKPVSLSPVRPVLQKFYGRRTPRAVKYDDPCQGVLNL
jgi:hypothetical protein